MSSRTANGRWVYLDSTDRGVSTPEPLTYNVGGKAKAELLAAVLGAIKRIQSMAEDGPSVDVEDDVRHIAVSRGIDQIPFESYQGRLRAHLRWQDYVGVLAIGLLIVDIDGSPFGMDSQVSALLALLDIDTKELDVAEEDFFDHMWASRHEAWIRLILNAVRFAWADRVKVVTETKVASMV